MYPRVALRCVAYWMRYWCRQVILPATGKVGRDEDFLACPALQRDHRNRAGDLRLMLGEEGMQRHHSLPYALPLGAFRDDSGGGVGFVANLDGDVRVRNEVVIPVRVGWGARIGGDNDQAVTVGYVHNRHRTGLAAPGARRREQEQGSARKRAAGLLAVRAELLDEMAVVIVLVGHNTSNLMSASESGV